MSPLWTSADIALATQGTECGSFTATGVSIDSRTLEPGDLFIALRGPNFDGHQFIEKAFDQGASGIVSEISQGNRSHVLVKDSAQAMQDLAIAARQRTKAKIIAVTGSVGKTSTKEMLRLACNAFGAVHASLGNLNNHWGVPLSLSRMPKDNRFGIFELGMNHAGEIGPLSRLVQPNLAIITEIAPAHLEFFKSVEEIADAKSEIFEGIVSGGAAILPLDNPYFKQLKRGAEKNGVASILTFGSNPGAYAQLVEYTSDAKGASVLAEIGGERIQYRLGATGRHLAMNSVAVLAAISFLQTGVREAASRLGQFAALMGRGLRTQITLPQGGMVELIDESYNASPASMRAALNMLAEGKPPKGRTIAVLGDMRELGEESAKLHAALADAILGRAIDRVFLCGPHMKHLWQILPEEQRGDYQRSSLDLIEKVVADLQAGDRILVKGSLGTVMAPIVDAILVLGGVKGGMRVV